MIQSKKRVKDICDQLFHVKPSQIVIDLVQDEIEELLTEDDVTPDQIGAEIYGINNLLAVYNPEFGDDINYLSLLCNTLNVWHKDATLINKTLGIDPNK